MKELIIIGAGDVGGFLALNQELFKSSFNIIGFLDDDENKRNKTFWGIPILGGIKDIIRYKNISVVVGIANPVLKDKIIKLIGEEYDFPSFIPSNSWVSNKVKIGKGVIIYPNTSINYETVIDDFSIINMNCAIGHNTRIGRCSSLAPGVNLAGFTNIEENVEMGLGVSTIQQIKIGRNSIIGGNSMLINNVPEGVTVVGNPARVINK